MARGEYTLYTKEQITRELLDGIKVGDFVKFGNARRGMRVWGVSKNYILAGTKSFHGQYIYTVIWKELWTGQYNAMNKDTFIHGPDDTIFGYLHDHAYELDNEEFVKDYLNAFEKGEIIVSHRRSVSIHSLKIRRPSGKGSVHE